VRRRGLGTYDLSVGVDLILLWSLILLGSERVEVYRIRDSQSE
jgi:hypothetical protein